MASKEVLSEFPIWDESDDDIDSGMDEPPLPRFDLIEQNEKPLLDFEKQKQRIKEMDWGGISCLDLREDAPPPVDYREILNVLERQPFIEYCVSAYVNDDLMIKVRYRPEVIDSTELRERLIALQIPMSVIFFDPLDEPQTEKPLLEFRNIGERVPLVPDNTTARYKKIMDIVNKQTFVVYCWIQISSRMIEVVYRPHDVNLTEARERLIALGIPMSLIVLKPFVYEDEKVVVEKKIIPSDILDILDGEDYIDSYYTTNDGLEIVFDPRLIGMKEARDLLISRGVIDFILKPLAYDKE